MGGPARHTWRGRREVPDPPRSGPHLNPPAERPHGLPEEARPSPNIWYSPQVYEIENRAADPDGRLAEALHALYDWSGRVVLDVGCGTGFHLPWFAAAAASVIGVEPHPDLAAIARRRCRRVRNVTVLSGTAQHLPLPDHSVDLAHARWAYFFGPGCEPGLDELSRVLRPDGVAVVVDNDVTTSTFGSWFRRGHPDYDPLRVEAFWSEHGWQRVRVAMGWRFRSREELESVVGIEYDLRTAEAVLAEHRGLDVDYAVNLWWRRY